MKRMIGFFLVCLTVFSFAACESSGGATTDKVEKVLDPMEYTIYMNVFYSKQGDQYVNKEYTKEGIFTVLKDSFNKTTRYYVWGYSDETLCCDWQWEFVPEDPDELPPIGSRVKVTGSFAKNDGALDGYWLENASVETVRSFTGAYGDNDTTTMSPTLTRVQLINMVRFPAEYNGQSIKIYGRVASGNKLQHPYYDGAWEIPLEYGEALPAIGTYVTVVATFSGTSSADSRLIVESIESD